jgi:hypothetical protein
MIYCASPFISPFINPTPPISVGLCIWGHHSACQLALQLCVSLGLLCKQFPPGVRFLNKIIFYRLGRTGGLHSSHLNFREDNFSLQRKYDSPVSNPQPGGSDLCYRLTHTYLLTCGAESFLRSCH